MGYKLIYFKPTLFFVMGRSSNIITPTAAVPWRRYRWPRRGFCSPSGCVAPLIWPKHGSCGTNSMRISLAPCPDAKYFFFLLSTGARYSSLQIHRFSTAWMGSWAAAWRGGNFTRKSPFPFTKMRHRKHFSSLATTPICDISQMSHRPPKCKMSHFRPP